MRNISALPRRPVIGLRVAKRNASGLCAFVEVAVPALEQAKHIEAYALTSVGTAANGSDSYCAACTTPPSEHEFHLSLIHI